MLAPYLKKLIESRNRPLWKTSFISNCGRKRVIGEPGTGTQRSGSDDNFNKP